jgi:hypothetical protein
MYFVFLIADKIVARKKTGVEVNGEKTRTWSILE